MKVIAPRDSIAAGIQRAAAVLPSRTGAQFLLCLWLQAEGEHLIVRGTDASVEFSGSYPARVEKSGLVGVNGRDISDLVRSFPAGDITFSVGEGESTLLVSQGKRKYHLPTFDVKYFQNVQPFPHKGTSLWSADFLSEILGRIEYFISDDATDENMSCLHLRRLPQTRSVEAMGTNGHRMGITTFINEDIYAILPEQCLLVQKKYIQTLKKWLHSAEIELCISEKHVFVLAADAAEYICLPLSNYSPIDTDHIIHIAREAPGDICSIDRTAMAQALGRLCIMNDDKWKCAYIDVDGGEMTISVDGKGKAAEVLPTSFTGHIDRVAFPTKDLREMLGLFASKDVQIRISQDIKPCLMTGVDDAGYEAVIMPMKLVEKTYYSEGK